MVYRKTSRTYCIFISLATLVTFLFNALPLSAEDLHLESLKSSQVTVSEIPLTPSFASMDADASVRRLRFIARANALFGKKYTTFDHVSVELARGFGTTHRETLEDAAVKIFNAYNRYYFQWQKITTRAKGIFEQKAWSEALHDGRERLELYGRSLDGLEEELRSLLGARAIDKRAWEDIRTRFKQGMLGRYDQDLAITYFYSVMRRIFAPANVPVEYDDDGIVDEHALRLKEKIYSVYYKRGPTTTADVIRKILLSPGYAQFENFERDITRVSEYLEKDLFSRFGSKDFKSISMLKSVFYRNKGAYLIGRLRLKNNETIPFILSLVHPESGIAVDAVLADEESVSSIFSYTRSNFHVEVSYSALRVSYYREMVEFLKTVMPRKDKADLLSAIGFTSPAKIAFTESLRKHLKETKEKFTATKGEKGTVMITFTLDTLPYIFKIISDKDKQRKRPQREPSEIAAKYDEVHMADRVGRLLDTMVFTNMHFTKSDFSEETYAEILRWAPDVLIHQDDGFIIKNLYVQRKLTPLDIYLEEQKNNPEEIKRILTDLGNLIKELAFIDKWPGPWDLHIKNVGVTYFGKAVLYDYDELSPFRHLNFVQSVPQEFISTDSWDEPDPSFVSTDYLERIFYKRVSLHDLLYNMNVPFEHWEIFREAHPDLFQVDYYENIKRRIKQDDIIDYFPYPARTRIREAGFGAEMDSSILRMANRLSQSSGQTANMKPTLVIAEHFKEIYFALQSASGRAMFGDPDKIIILHSNDEKADRLGRRFRRMLERRAKAHAYEIATGSFSLLKQEIVVNKLQEKGFFYIGNRGMVPENLKDALYRNNAEITEWAVWLGGAIEHELRAKQSIQAAA